MIPKEPLGFGERYGPYSRTPHRTPEEFHREIIIRQQASDFTLPDFAFGMFDHFIRKPKLNVNALASQLQRLNACLLQINGKHEQLIQKLRDFIEPEGLNW